MKKIVCTFAVLALVLSIIGCSWETPEKVKVKTNAEYNFSLGNLEKDLTTDLSINTLLGNVTLPNNGKIYDYWPNPSETEQRVLMYLPLSEIPIDFSQYFNSGALSSSLTGMSFEKEFDIPAVSLSFNLPVEIDTLNSTINNSFKLTGPALGEYELSTAITEVMTRNGKSFTSLSYKTGKFIVTASNEDSSTVTIESNGVTRTGTFNGGTAEINIDNFTFKTNSLKIKFSAAGTGDFSSVISNDSEISKVEGFTSEPIEVSLNENIDALSSLSSIEQCTIGTGSLTVNMAIPSSWSGVTPTYDLTFTGGLSVSGTDMSNPAELSLNDKDLSSDAISAHIDLKLAMDNATIVFANKPSASVSTNITQIKSATVTLSGSPLSVNAEQDIPAEIRSVVKKIYLNQCGIKGTYINTLPEGNNITLAASSSIFGITNGTKVFSHSTSETNFQILSSNTEAREVSLGTGTGEYSKFDFDVDVTLPGGESDKITLTNVVPGETYSISLNIEPVIDWESVDINPSAITSALGAGAGSQTIDTHFNPGTIFTTIDDTLKNMVGENTFVSNLQFPECNLHLYITKPQITAFDGLSFNGSTVKMYYKAGSSKNDETVIMGTGVNENLGFANKPNIKVTKTSDGSDVVTAPITGASLDLAIADVLNNGKKEENKNATLCVDYNLQIDGVNGSAITINKSDLSNSSGSIGIYAYIDIPLKLNLSADSNIDLTNIVQQSVSGDLFGRSDASGLDEVEKFLDAFESVSVAYSTKKLPVKCGEMTFTAVFKDGSGTTVLTKDIPIGTRAGNLKIESADVRKLLNAYPLTVEPKISIPSGEFSIPREKKVDLDISLKIKTDGTIDLM